MSDDVVVSNSSPDVCPLVCSDPTLIKSDRLLVGGRGGENRKKINKFSDLEKCKQIIYLTFSPIMSEMFHASSTTFLSLLPKVNFSRKKNYFDFRHFLIFPPPCNLSFRISNLEKKKIKAGKVTIRKWKVCDVDVTYFLKLNVILSEILITFYNYQAWRKSHRKRYRKAQPCSSWKIPIILLGGSSWEWGGWGGGVKSLQKFLI